MGRMTASRSTNGHAHAPAGAPIRVLLVEDHEDSLEVLTVLLGERYAVTSCRSGAEALRVVADARPTVVVLDIGMAPIDGVECLKRIRATPGCENVPAIALTGWARQMDRERFVAEGFQAVVVKPVLDERELVTAIEKHAMPAATASTAGG